MMAADALVGLAVGLVAVGLSALVARRRADRGSPPASRAGRAFYAAFAFALVQLLFYGIYAGSRPGGGAQFASNFLFTLMAFACGSFLLFGLVEWLLGFFRPERSAGWMGAALAAFVVAGAGGLAAPVWLAAGQVTLRPGLLLPVLSASAAALIWWAFLPAPLERRPTRLG
jgi:hypothetical protein